MSRKLMGLRPAPLKFENVPSPDEWPGMAEALGGRAPQNIESLRQYKESRQSAKVNSASSRKWSEFYDQFLPEIPDIAEDAVATRLIPVFTGNVGVDPLEDAICSKHVDIDVFKQAQENFAKWNAALKGLDFAEICAFYDVEPRIKEFRFELLEPPQGPEDISSCAEDSRSDDHFAHFIANLTHAEISSSKITVFSSTAYLHTGICTSVIARSRNRDNSKDPLRRPRTAPSSPSEAAKVRFSYLWSKIEGTWRIEHHHSSLNLSNPSPSNVNY